MNLRSAINHRFFPPLLGAVISALCGLVLWKLPAGEAWADASYDYLFRFATRAVTNQVALIQLDGASYSALDQQRGQPWDRELHAQLLNKLSDDGCALVVFDILFRDPGASEKDEALARAIRRHGRVALMARLVEPEHPDLRGVQIELPHQRFLEQAQWGIGNAGVPLGSIVRRHWPFPAPDSTYQSLAWTAAKMAGADLPAQPVEQWLRYYGEGGPWARYSYHLALAKPPRYFRNAIVFIGGQPESLDPGLVEQDKFSTPYSRWNDKGVGGVEIVATTFLNLLNRDWLERTPEWLEGLAIVLLGGLIGAFVVVASLRRGMLRASGMGALILVGAASLSYFTRYWFPWLIVAGAQVPCAVLCLAALQVGRPRLGPSGTVIAPSPSDQPVAVPDRPDAPEYTFVAPPFGEGGFGKVWLVRNAIGQWQALKAVYQAKFGENTKPYEAEFRGIQHYKPISTQHLGLLNVDFVSNQKAEGYFYYVMELGDGREPGWEEKPETYQPLDLAQACARHDKNRLPVHKCAEIGLALADALTFLHEKKNLTHRDIKPSNIIFVQGKPKLADVGLVTPARRAEDVTTFAGTPGYMPPPPEPPGTIAADIYALGKVLFVISTGRSPLDYPYPQTSLAMEAANAEFMFLNRVIVKACAADLDERFASVAELRKALEKVEKMSAC